ncbi:ribonuclease III [Patescibacteria group bacterium]|nr:ribonuclease III [Patescibacteria group bacterium]MBU4098323.1 ribonuclease III [Patescibacteria group bacterium]
MQNLPKLKNQKLATQAFIHRSYLNEAKKELESNERLEFLGDSILSFVISDHLFRNYPDFDEGVLTNLRSLVVNTKSLAKEAKLRGFGKNLLLSKGEEESNGRENDSILANTFEAFIGALFVDQGIESVKEFLKNTLIPHIKEFVEKKVFKDPKSLLQENVQAKKQNSPIYKVLSEEGPAHAKIFTVGVFIENQKKGTGTGRSKQEAEEFAAEKALEKIDK